MKRCYTCKKNKGENKFCKSGHRCKDCEKIRDRERGKKPRRIYGWYKLSAKKRDHSFNITFDQFNLFYQRPCYYCNTPIDRIGLDRIDDKKGYEIDNIVSCCKNCNYGKEHVRQAVTRLHLSEDVIIKILKVIIKYK